MASYEAGEPLAKFAEASGFLPGVGLIFGDRRTLRGIMALA